MFRAFQQFDADRSGLGLGLSIARRAVEASGGALSVRDMPGHGCVFTIELPGPARADVEAIYARISELDPGPDSWPFSDTVIVFGKLSVEELRAILA